jgi:hypothetical protein
LIAGTFGMVAIFLTQATVVEGYFIGGVVALLALYAIYRLERRTDSGRDRATAQDTVTTKTSVNRESS